MTVNNRPRSALVTGASRGIGAAVAIGLAERGYDLGLNDIPAQACLPAMKRQRYGRIVSIASPPSGTAGRRRPRYAASASLRTSSVPWPFWSATMQRSSPGEV